MAKQKKKTENRKPENHLCQSLCRCKARNHIKKETTKQVYFGGICQSFHKNYFYRTLLDDCFSIENPKRMYDNHRGWKKQRSNSLNLITERCDSFFNIRVKEITSLLDCEEGTTSEIVHHFHKLRLNFYVLIQLHYCQILSCIRILGYHKCRIMIPPGIYLLKVNILVSLSFWCLYCQL